MIQVNRIYLIFNRLVTKKFLVDTSESETILSKELDNLTCFFNRNLDFYQYYRFHSTLYDEYYVVRGKFDLRLCTDSAQFDKDLNFSTLFLRVALTMATWE